MAWASSGGYPGVASDGAGGLILAGAISSLNALLRQGTSLTVLDSHGDPIATLGRDSEVLSLIARSGIGYFRHAAPASPVTGGVATAGGTYTAVEQAMLEAAYTALQSIGLVT